MADWYADWHLAILLAALVADRIFGEPALLWHRLPHPVAVFGKAVGALDRQFNLESDSDGLRLRKGAIGVSVLILVAAGLGHVLAWLLQQVSHAGPVLEGFVVFTLLAQKSLLDHVTAVADGLSGKGLSGGRAAVAKIVGRDPETLDRTGIARAAIESVAENFSDGVVAPAFWYAVFGLPGLLAYKMINTADSMIGYRSVRHEQFGRIAAQIDDLANWLPARLSAGLIALAALMTKGAASARRALSSAIADSGLHRSPNAGWPEAAMAGACGFALGGPRIYPGGRVEQAFLNAAGRRDLDGGDIRMAVRLTDAACMALWGLVLLLAIAT
ncbi:MAG: cobalamin biosynthesis protein [Nitratireductor sp.]|nr:cobalamin biosynthesis protein [Nitratireductor sp.]